MTDLPASSGSASSRLISPFYPALDGLRAIAFLMVFASHYVTLVSNSPILKWGWVGVDLFFVLSGFLITGILFDALEKPRYFQNFYIRRALRIFPLFYAVWIFFLLATPFLHILWTRYNFLMMAYLGNFVIPGGVAGHHFNPTYLAYYPARHPGEVRYFLFGHLWSLCIEEQFYLIWPAVVFYCRSRKSLLRICLFVIVLSPLARAACLHKLLPGTLYVSTFFRLDTLLVGAAVALWLRGPSPSTQTMMRMANTALVSLPLVLALILVLSHHPSASGATNPVLSTIGYTFIAFIAAAVLLLAINPQTTIARFLRWRPLSSLGRISYGMYLLHSIPATYFLGKLVILAPRHLQFLMPLGAFLFTWGAAWLSFRFFESPFLRLKSRLAPQTGHIADPTPIPGPAIHASTTFLSSPTV